MNWFDYYHEFNECIEHLEAFQEMACINSHKTGPRLYAQFVGHVDIWDIFEYIKETHDNMYFQYESYETFDERILAVYYSWFDGPNELIYVKVGESV